MSSIKKNFAYNSFLSVSSHLINLILFPYCARVLGVERFGTVWDVVYTYSGFYDTYFGYEKPINNVDVFGKEVTDNSNTYFAKIYRFLLVSK